MQPKLRLGKLFMLLLPLFVMVFTFSTNISIAQTSTATVTTDKDDYPPGSTVYITGSGFSSNENVTLQVEHEGETGDNDISGAHAPWTVSADANGNISAQWTVPFDEDELGATLKLTADGQSSRLHAEWTFTDANTFQNVQVSDANGKLSYKTKGDVIYEITINRPVPTPNQTATGNFCLTGATPAGVTPNFYDLSDNNFTTPITSVNFGKQETTKKVILRFSGVPNSSVGNYPFSVTIWNRTNANTNSCSTATDYVTGSFILSIAKATATLSLVQTDLSQTYSDTKAVGITINPSILSSGVTVKYTGINGTNYDESTTAPTNAGSYSVVASLTDNNYEATNATGTLVIDKAVATVSLGNLTPTYDGTSKAATATANATGTSSFTFTYDGSSTAPTNAGSYNVVATLVNNNYKGSATGTFTISQAPNAITFTNPGTKTYGDADFNLTASATSGGAVSFEVTSGNATVSGSTVHITGAGDVNIKATQGGDANYLAADPVSQTFTVNKATATVTLGSLTPTYTGSSLAATATTNPSGLKVDITYDGSTTAPTNAGSYKVVGTINDANYQGSSTNTLVIDKAASTVTVVPISTTYDGAAHSTTASVSGAGGLNSALNVTYSSGSAPVDAGSYTASASYAGDDNHYFSNGSAAIDIAQAAATISVSDLNKVYNGSTQGATVTTTPADLAVTITYAGSATVPTNAGSYAVVAKLNNDNYKATDGSGTLIIDKATPSVSIDPASLSATYDGNTHEATATVTGVNHASLTGVTISYTQGTPPVNVSSPINAGDYTVEASFNGNDNYYPASQSGTLKIKKADQTITVTTAAPSSATYNTGFTVTATASSGLTVTYSSVAPLSNTGANYTMTSGTGTGTVKINQAGNDNYNPAPEVTVNVTAVKANQTITWATPTAITYPTALSAAQLNATTTGDGELSYSPALGTILGAGDQTLRVTAKATDNYNEATESVTLKVDKGTPTITWSNPTGITYGTALGSDQLNATANVSGTFNYTPAVGEYLHAGNGQKLSVSFTPTDANNYNGASKDVTIDVAKANPSIVVNGYNGTYDGSAHGAIIETASGAHGEDLSSAVTLGDKFTNVPGGTANWSFAGDNDHNPASGSASIGIAKATPTISLVVGGPYTYSNSEHGVQSATVSGVTINGTSENLGNATVIYNNSSTLPVNAGSYAVVASYAGNDNYNAAANQTGTLVIDKADANVSVTGYSGTYDGNAHGASGSATGVGGADLKSSLNLGASFTDAPGGTVNWSFNGGTNYNDQSGRVEIAIAKATPTITLTVGDAPTYDGNTHHVQSAVVTGINNTTLGNAAVEYKQGTTIVTDPTSAGDYAVTASYAATTNYNAATPQTGTLTINKATASISVNPYEVTYDGNAHTSTGTATGVESTPVDLSSLLTLSGTTHTNGGTYAGDTWSFTGNNNYEAANGTVDNKINKANATFTIAGYNGTYDGDAHTASGTATGVKGEDLSSLLSFGTGITNVPGGSVTWSFAGDGNYNSDGGLKTITLSKANATISITPYTVKYDGDAHTATGSARGVKGEALSGLDLSNTTHTNAGSYTTDSWSFTDATGNYNDVAVTTITDVIGKADATITANGYNGMFDNNSHSATGTATGVKGEDLSSSLNLGASFTAAPGGTANWTFTGGTNYNDANGTVSIRIYAIPTVTLSTPSPVAINNTSIVTAALGPDVFNSTWVYTSPSANTTTSTTQLNIKSATPIVYSVSLSYEDGMGRKYTSPSVYVVFYDPSAGFVTGGGWINSTPVDEVKCSTCAFMRVGGKANFGFESKYEKGKTIPTGNTEFQFQAAGMNFKSSNYEWLVISGTKAQYKGTGTINGTGNYGFMLTAVDGDLGTNKSADLFRIKIWDINNGSAIVYDNQYGYSDDATLNTQLGGGSIVIHDTKASSKSIITAATTPGRDVQLVDAYAGKLKVTAMPNPATSQFNLLLQSSNTTEEMTMIVVNESGRVMEMRQHLTAGQTIQLGSNYRPGIYYVQVIQGDKKEQVQLMKLSN